MEATSHQAAVETESCSQASVRKTLSVVLLAVADVWSWSLRMPWAMYHCRSCGHRGCFGMDHGGILVQGFCAAGLAMLDKMEARALCAALCSTEKSSTVIFSGSS